MITRDWEYPHGDPCSQLEGPVRVPSWWDRVGMAALCAMLAPVVILIARTVVQMLEGR